MLNNCSVKSVFKSSNPREILRTKLQVRLINQITENIDFYGYPLLEIMNSFFRLPWQQETRASWKGQIMRMNDGREACFSNFSLHKNFLERILQSILRHSDSVSLPRCLKSSFPLGSQMLLPCLLRGYSLSSSGLEKVCSFYIPVLNRRSSDLCISKQGIWYYYPSFKCFLGTCAFQIG